MSASLKSGANLDKIQSETKEIDKKIKKSGEKSLLWLKSRGIWPLLVLSPIDPYTIKISSLSVEFSTRKHCEKYFSQ
jgi:hypothetical protein